jgi:ankyrin repeat protein
MSPLKSHKRRSRRDRGHTGNASSPDGSGNELSGPALLEACLLGRIGFVESLLRLGAPVHIRTDEGDTPLILAAVQGSCAVVNQLIDAGADLDAHNGHGLTALMEAAFWGNIEVAKILVERGADIHAKDHQGHTALDWAVHEDRREIVGLLEAAKCGGGSDDPNGSGPTVSLPRAEARELDPDRKSREGGSCASLMLTASRYPETTLPRSAETFAPQAAFGVRDKNGLSGKRGW